MPLRARKRRALIIVGALTIIATLAVLWVLRLNDPLRARARRAWRDRAVAVIQQRADDATWMKVELDRLKARAATRSLDGWVGDELLVMKNGDWIICQNVCAKEQKTGVERDLFVGRGSDGEWYYSTFHFCVGKCVLQMETQPQSLAQFVDAYWLQPFDGKSDRSLNETWKANQPWGEEKLQSASAPR